MKLRVVFDTSSNEYKYSKSLNDCLHVGPPLQPMMYDILIRFQMYPAALLGDIEKAFLQIRVSPEDRDVMQFIWIKNVKQEPPELQTWQFTKVIFGSGKARFYLVLPSESIWKTIKQKTRNSQAQYSVACLLTTCGSQGKRFERSRRVDDKAYCKIQRRAFQYMTMEDKRCGPLGENQVRIKGYSRKSDSSRKARE